MAEEYQLFPVYKEEFHQVYQANQNHPEFGPLMVRMKVVDSTGGSAMDEDQWEAASSSSHVRWSTSADQFYRYLHRVRVRETLRQNVQCA
jgi:hypothetical protein